MSNLKLQIIEILKSKAIKLALLQLIGRSAGFKAWLLELILSYGFDQLAKPVLLYAYRRGYRVIETLEGKQQIKKLESAEDKKAYEDALTDIFK